MVAPEPPVQARRGDPHQPPSSASRLGRVVAVAVLVLATAVAVWLREPEERAPERAGGLASWSGATTTVPVDPVEVRWSASVASAPVPVAVEAVAAHPDVPVVVTADAVWVLDDTRRRVVAELPRLAGTPRPDGDGRLAVLDSGRLVIVDAATGRVVERVEVPRLTVSAPTWAVPTPAGWAVLDGGLVHAGQDGASWRAPDRRGDRLAVSGGTLVTEGPDGLEGHDPATGGLRWAEADLALLDVTAELVVTERPTGEVDVLDGTDGRLLRRVSPTVLGEVLGVAGDHVVGLDGVVEGAPDGDRLVAVPLRDGSPTTARLPTSRSGEVLLPLEPLGDRLGATDGSEIALLEVDGSVVSRRPFERMMGLAGDGDLVVLTDDRGSRVLDVAFGAPYLPAVPRAPRGGSPYRPAASGPVVSPVAGLVLDLDDGTVVAGAAPDTTAARVLGLAEGLWEQSGGRTVVTERGGEVRWRSGGGTVATPVADTPWGVVAVVDDRALGAVRLIDPLDGRPRGDAVLDAGFVDATPVAEDLVVGAWQERGTDQRSTVAVDVGPGGLHRRWRVPAVGQVVGMTDDLVWLVRPGLLVGLDADDGHEVRTLPLDVLSADVVLVDDVAVAVADHEVHGVPLDGSAGWEVPLERRATAAAAVSAGRVHVGLQDGHVLTIGPDGEVLGDVAVGDEDVRAMVAAGDLLLVRTDGGLVAVGR